MPPGGTPLAAPAAGPRRPDPKGAPMPPGGTPLPTPAAGPRRPDPKGAPMPPGGTPLAAPPRRSAPESPGGASRPGGGAQAGFTLVEAVFALGLTLVVSAGFLLLLRHGRVSLNLHPEVSAMRLDGRAALDRIAADLVRAGSGFPVEVPLFTDLAPAGDRDPDGLDFLAAPERLADASFEPVIAFDGSVATLAVPESGLAASPGSPDRWALVFNDDEMTPRWVFGRVTSVSGGGAGSATAAVKRTLTRATAPGDAPTPAPGARVRIAAAPGAWHQHFRSSVDADTFAPGSGGGLIERGLQSLLGGVIQAALPAVSAPALNGLTDQVVGQVLETVKKRRGARNGVVQTNEEDTGGYGLFGLGQPGVVPVSRIRYRVRDARPGDGDGRRVLMRRVNEEPPQPVGFVEDLQVRYLTGENADTFHDSPPGFVGDMRTAAHLGNHIVRAVEVAVRVRSVRAGMSAAPGAGAEAPGSGPQFLTRTYRRRIGLRIRAHGVERRAWEETMQLNALPTGIPRIGPLRFVKLPW